MWSCSPVSARPGLPGAPPTTQGHLGLVEHLMNESVGPARGLGQRADVGALLVLRLQIGCQLGAGCSGDAVCLGRFPDVCLRWEWAISPRLRGGCRSVRSRASRRGEKRCWAEHRESALNGRCPAGEQVGDWAGQQPRNRSRQAPRQQPGTHGGALNEHSGPIAIRVCPKGKTVPPIRRGLGNADGDSTTQLPAGHCGGVSRRSAAAPTAALGATTGGGLDLNEARPGDGCGCLR